LPKSDGEAVALDEPYATALSLQGKGTLLFVEDDPLVRASVSPALSSAGFTVIEAENADQALKVLATEKHIDLLFSDVVMPGELSGIDLARIVRERYPDMPVLLASGHSDLRINLSNVRMLGKPYDLDAVTAILIEMKKNRRAQ
jgi:DNA-binding NtrC family response regulator